MWKTWVGSLGWIPGLGRSPGEGNGCPLQYSGLENSLDCVIRGAAKSQTRLSDFHFHWWLSGKESACKAGDAADMGSILGSGRSPGEGNGSPLQCSCLENPMDRGAWWVIVHGAAKSRT